MKLDEVMVLNPRSYFEKPARVMYERSKGYDLTATSFGVLVERLKDCTVQMDRGEPLTVLIPWPQVSGSCAVSQEQPKSK